MRRIAIIGGGPGGAHCASRLAEAGRDVTLFEPRTRFEKPCGGGLPARSLDSFPFLDDARLPARTLRTCQVIAPSGAAATIPLREPLRVFRRADLHQFLLGRATAAGARLVRERVVAFGPAGGGSAPPWTITSIDAGGRRAAHAPFDFLIAADGAGGFSRRRLAGGIPAAELTQAVGYYLPEPTEQTAVLKFCAEVPGYLWVFPRVDHDAAGICGPLGAMPVAALRTILDRFLAERYGPGCLARATAYAALIPGAPVNPQGLRLQGEGWALVGDTSRSVDPLTREGIHYAMESGELLAGALIAGAPETYSTLWRRNMGREFSWAGRHAAEFFAPRTIERLVALCARSPRTAGILSDLVSGRQRYRTLALRLLANGPVIAWQAIRPAPRPDGQLRSWQLKH
ncbi:MAG TPA: NAD(P)/FAD-dependent oxidoreductase [Patescibacteria group bacterium]|nr:NAD(P)/FAD-dependent oxidoreductase [Patescibacteria group bacterium]